MKATPGFMEFPRLEFAMSNVEIRRAFYGDLPVVVFEEIQTESNRNSPLVIHSVQTLYRLCSTERRPPGYRGL